MFFTRGREWTINYERILCGVTASTLTRYFTRMLLLTASKRERYLQLTLMKAVPSTVYTDKTRREIVSFSSLYEKPLLKRVYRDMQRDMMSTSCTSLCLCFTLLVTTGSSGVV
jgi:hypothetical protein